MTVVALPCRIELRTLGLPIARRAEFERSSPSKPLWNRRDPEHCKLLDWLNSETPGWQDDARITGYGHVQPPVGADAGRRMPVFWVTHWLQFQLARHARAFRDWRASADLHSTRRAHLLTPGEQGCEGCGGPTTRKLRTETSRIGPVELAYTASLPWCDGCESDAGVLIAGDDAAVWRQSEILLLIRSALGLPRADPRNGHPTPALIRLAARDTTPDGEILAALDAFRIGR